MRSTTRSAAREHSAFSQISAPTLPVTEVEDLAQLECLFWLAAECRMLRAVRPSSGDQCSASLPRWIPSLDNTAGFEFKCEFEFPMQEAQ